MRQKSSGGEILGRNYTDKLIQQLIVTPLIVIVGIYVVASVISSLFFGGSNQFVNGFFCAVGGVGYFIKYFKEKMRNL
jgi:hypothetical protein